MKGRDRRKRARAKREAVTRQRRTWRSSKRESLQATNEAARNDRKGDAMTDH